ncbi:small T antigen [Bear-associated polyomavirus 1]|nr:small T antigen [Bear-associated polyomavirus 1]
MDKALSRQESKDLMDLLQLPMKFYGHLPVMRKAFLAKSKEYHPDKGGDEEKCKKLTTLYRKLEESVKNDKGFESMWAGAAGASHSWRSADVSNKPKDQAVGRNIEFWRNFDLCVRNVNKRCPCLMCKLKRKHLWSSKEFRVPICWGKCYCYSCYCLWFGFAEKDHSSAVVWIGMIADLTWGDLNLW